MTLIAFCSPMCYAATGIPQVTSWNWNMYPNQGSYTSEVLVLVRCQPSTDPEKLYLYVIYDDYPVIQRQANIFDPDAGEYRQQWDAKFKIPAVARYQTQEQHTVTVRIEDEDGKSIESSKTFKVTSGAPSTYTAGPTGPVGPVGPAGPTGPQGTAGKSAYDLAVENGFRGTVKEWLASLVGAQGPAGTQGVKGDKGDAGAIGATGSTGANGQKGSQGPPGEQGVQGPRGEKGEQGAEAHPLILAACAVFCVISLAANVVMFRRMRG